MKILILNGPNLNLLGSREPEVYGENTLENLIDDLASSFPSIELDHFQSNWEGGIIDKLHEVDGSVDGVVLNAGGYTHTSVAIRDAISSISTNVVEVHISNIANREEFRHNSLIAPVCVGSISGFGTACYGLGIQAILSLVS